MQVGVRCISLRAAPPAVGDRMLTVIAVAHATISTALVITIGVLRSRITIDNRIAIAVGTFEV